MVFDKLILDETAEYRAAWVSYHAYHANPFHEPRAFVEFLPECLRRTGRERMSTAEMQQQFRKAKSRWPEPKRDKSKRKRHRVR